MTASEVLCEAEASSWELGTSQINTACGVMATLGGGSGYLSTGSMDIWNASAPLVGEYSTTAESVAGE